MKREIKFRAWIKDHEKMVTVYHWHQGDIMDTIEVSLFGRQQRFLADEYELMQYTGLKDKNGKDIYEGDVLKNTGGFIGEVAFEVGVFIFGNKKTSYEELGLYAFACEIIGNIHENPKILEQ